MRVGFLMNGPSLPDLESGKENGPSLPDFSPQVIFPENSSFFLLPFVLSCIGNKPPQPLRLPDLKS